MRIYGESAFLTIFGVAIYGEIVDFVFKKSLFRDYSRKIFDFWRVPIRTFLGPMSASGRPIARAYA